MPKPLDQESLASAVHRATSEAIDLGDFGFRVLPLINRLFETSTSLVYTCNPEGQIIPLAGDMIESVPYYSQHYFAIDILQENLLKYNPWMLHGSSMPNWEKYLSSAAYHECATKNLIDHFIHIRLNDCEMYEPGMIGLMFARTFRQPDFSEKERMLLTNLMPSFETFARRARRLNERLRTQPLFEAIFEVNQHPTVVFDSKGKLFWVSGRAASLLGISRTKDQGIPKSLKEAVFKFTHLLGKEVKFHLPPSQVKIPFGEDAFIYGEIHLIRDRNKRCFIVVELQDPNISPQLKEVSFKYSLTKSETQVLKYISLGLSDREISRHLFVSPATIHTHVNRILMKLDVSSRLKAALIAHGKRIS